MVAILSVSARGADEVDPDASEASKVMQSLRAESSPTDPRIPPSSSARSLLKTEATSCAVKATSAGREAIRMVNSTWLESCSSG